MFEISNSPHDMMCIQMENPTDKIRDFLRSIVMCNRIGDPDYEHSWNASAFHECDYKEYVLIEFWRKDGAQAFVDYVNKKWEAEMADDYQRFLKDPKTCNYCGNKFDDPQCTHSVCGME